MPGIVNLGIIPSQFASPGRVGVVSRSGTLTYEAMAGLTNHDIGQKYIIGIGGDPIPGTDFIECLELFEHDPDIAQIVMIGEIGGTSENAAASGQVSAGSSGGSGATFCSGTTTYSARVPDRCSPSSRKLTQS